MDTTLDPLRNSELHRALAFARARETYPGIGGELLLELCDAAWERAAGDTRDGGALERFERALDVVARSYRVGGGRLSVSEVADDAIPLAVLQPYIDAQKRRPAPVEPEPAPARRTLADKLPSLPRIAPAPVGVSLAAGVFGVAAAAQAGVLEQTPLAPLSFTDRSEQPAPADPSASADRGGSGAQAAPGLPSTSGGSGPSSPWVGELAAANAAGSDPGATAQGATPEPRGAGGSVAPSGSTGTAPVAATPVATPAPVAAPAPVSAPAPGDTPDVSVPEPSVPDLPEIQIDMGQDEDSGDERAPEQTPAGGEHEQAPPVGVHFPNIQLPGGVVVEIPQAGDDEDSEDQDASAPPDEGEEVPAENQLTPDEDVGAENAPDAQLPGQDDPDGQVPEDEQPEQPLPADEGPDGVAERVPAVTPPAPAPEGAPAPAPAPPATPPAPEAAPTATPAPAPAAPAPAPEPPAPAPPTAPAA